MIKSLVGVDYNTCGNTGAINYTTGKILKRFCSSQNRDGKCSRFEPKEPKKKFLRRLKEGLGL